MKIAKRYVLYFSHKKGVINYKKHNSKVDSTSSGVICTCGLSVLVENLKYLSSIGYTIKKKRF